MLSPYLVQFLAVAVQVDRPQPAMIVPAAARPPVARRVHGYGTPDQARDVAAFWRGAGPSLWFAKDAGFDARFRDRYLALHEAAARGELDGWARTSEGALALLILLDQFPRNAFRGSPRMYATDAQARRVADAVVTAGLDRGVEPAIRKFFYLPFAHSEDPADQDRSVALCAALGGRDFVNARRHREIVRRFGRFPHRNPILGRVMSAEERAYLDGGGYAG